MRLQAIGFAMVMSGMLCGQPPDKNPDKKLDGEWRCIGLVVNGEKQPRSLFSKIELRVEGKKWLEEANGKDLQEFTFKLLPDGVSGQGQRAF